jgi:glutamate/tyrosine decarboxylase-like PLP-dependent enzyme
MSATPPREPSFLDLDPETMRQMGYAAIDLAVDHLTRMESEPAWTFLSREEGERLLREPPPETGRPFPEILERARTAVLGHAGRIGHPRFFAFVPSAVTFPGVLGDFLAAAFNPFVGTWLGGSGPSMLELVVVDWLREMTGLPEGSGGLLTSGGSPATVIAFAAARHVKLGDRTERARIYASTETHSCVDRAAWITGFPPEALRKLPVDAEHRLDPGTLRAAVAEDRARGLVPFLVVGNAGSTSTGSIDPLGAIADVAAGESLWFHVDAAYGGFAALTLRGRGALAGMERGDSWVLDPHKWLYQGYECGSVLLRRPDDLRRAFRMGGAYLQDLALGETQPNFGESGLQLSRGARALKVWLSIQALGLDAFRRAVDRTLDLAAAAEARLRGDPRFELLAPARLGIVCFRLAVPGVSEAAREAANREALAALNRSGYAFLSSTRLEGRYALRLCVLSHRSTAADVEGVLERLALFRPPPVG